MALINSSDSLVVFLRLFQSDFFFYPGMGLVSEWKEKMERCEYLKYRDDDSRKKRKKAAETIRKAVCRTQHI